MFRSRKKKRRALDNVTEFGTRIGENSVFEGILRGADHYTVGGKIIGNCDLNGILYLEPGGVWQGEIIADVVVIAGTVEGNVSASSKLELVPTGKVKGNLKAPAIAIAENAIFDGKISMAKAKNISRFVEQRGVTKEKKDK